MKSSGLMESSVSTTTTRAWLILIFAALNVIFLGGKRRAFGIFVADFHNNDFRNISLAELNWIGDSYAAFGYLTTTLSTALILNSGRRYKLFQVVGAFFILIACITSALVQSAHLLFLTHTVLHGIGSSLILSTVGLVVNEHFDKSHRYHILATTLVSGGSVASIVFVQFYAYLIEEYKWRKAFVILGILYFLINVSAAFVFKRNSTVNNNYKQNKCSLDYKGHVTKRHVPLLILWTLDRIATSIVTYGMLLNLADYLMQSSKQLTKSTSLTIMFAGGEASTYLIGAILTGLTKDLLKNRLKYILLITTGIMALSLIFWEFVTYNPFLSHFLSYLSGFCLGPSITFLFPAGEEVTQLPGHLAYPFSLGGMGIGMLLSPTLSAVIASAFKYHGFFLVQGVIISIKFICLVILCILTKHPIESEDTIKPNLAYSKLSQDDLNDTTTDYAINSTDDNIKIRVR